MSGGLSGGQRRRVTIAIELLSGPAPLEADQKTHSPSPTGAPRVHALWFHSAVHSAVRPLYLVAPRTHALLCTRSPCPPRGWRTARTHVGPALVLLDEPTSGLDAYGAQQVVACLAHNAASTQRQRRLSPSAPPPLRGGSMALAAPTSTLKRARGGTAHERRSGFASAFALLGGRGAPPLRGPRPHPRLHHPPAARRDVPALPPAAAGQGGRDDVLRAGGAGAPHCLPHHPRD